MSNPSSVHHFWNRCVRGKAHDRLRALRSSPNPEEYLLAWANQEGYDFTINDYLLAISQNIEDLPVGMESTKVAYRKLLEEGKWAEIIDGVIIGG